MSFEIPTGFVQQFHADVMHLAQQQGSGLAGTTLEDNITGEKGFWDQIGLAHLVKKTVRHGDTVHTEIPHARRMVVTEDYTGSELIDKEDQFKLLMQPSGEYAQAFAFAVGRLRDDVIIAAASATAYTGKDGTTATPFDTANNRVAVDFVRNGAAANSNLTVDKVKRASKILNAHEVEMNDRHAVISASGLESLMGDDEFTSRDYNIMQPLSTGMMPVQWMGFTWHLSERLAITSASIRTNLFYQKRGIKVGIGRGPVFRISERDDKDYATQVHVSVSWGGTRMEEKRVVEVLTDETVL